MDAKKFETPLPAEDLLDESFETGLELQPENELPPDTSQFLSWSAISFIRAPANTRLLYPIFGIFMFLTIMIATCFTFKVDTSFQTNGSLHLQNSKTVRAESEGIIKEFFVSTNDHVKTHSRVAALEPKNSKNISPIEATQDGVIVRKLASPGDPVKPGDPIAVISDTKTGWLVESTLSTEDLLKVRNGMAVTHYFIGKSFDHLGPIQGKLIDWHNRNGQPQDHVTIDLSFEPNATQLAWLEEHRAQVVYANISTHYSVDKIPLSKLILNSILNQ